jgi:hypothetical protein
MVSRLNRETRSLVWISWGTSEPLVLLLNREDASVRQWAVEALCCLALPEESCAVGAVEPLSAPMKEGSIGAALALSRIEGDRQVASQAGGAETEGRSPAPRGTAEPDRRRIG